MKKPKSIHFVGIKGVGVAPLSIIAKEAGIQVTGSDIAEEFITDNILKKAGIEPLVGFSKDHVGAVELVITTGAHGGFENIEVQEARSRGITILTQGQAVGEFMQGEILGRSDLKGISVTGSHGKTTTSAMVATMLYANGMDPSFVIGTSDIPSLGSSGHYGKGEYFVAEADEYATEPTHDKTPKFLWQKPQFLVFTNIELDHPDLYKDVDEIREAFLKFTNNVQSDGSLIVYGDDAQVQKLLQGYTGKRVTYGFSSNNEFRIVKLSVSADETQFWITHNDTDLGQFVLGVSGEHNALNAAACIVVGFEVGLSIEQIKKGLLSYTGSKRRFEYVGKLPTGALVYDDYAHHPTEIRNTLKTFRQKFPEHSIICIFQPHTYSRTKALFNDFVHAFSDADTVILADIYASLREEKDSTISSRVLVEEIKKIHKNVLYIPGLIEIGGYVKSQNYPQNTIILTMGAGDVYKIGHLVV